MNTLIRRVGSFTRSWMSILGAALAFFVFTSFVAGDALGQEASTVENVVQVKLTESAKAQLVEAGEALPKTVSQIQRTGVAALDQVARQYEATRMERIFRPAGKHEPRHVEWGLDRWYTIRYEVDAAPETVANTYLEAEAQIESASPVYEKAQTVLDETPEWVDEGESGQEGASERRADEEPTFIPDDPEYGTQWHYDNTEDNVGTPDADINLPEAHDIETGDSEVVVSVVDGGADLDHPDLEPMLWTNEDEIPGNGEDDDNNGFVDDVHGYDHANDDGEPEANGSHGTHVAGTVAAKNGNGQFGAGIAGGDGSEGSGIRLMINKTFGAAGNAGFAEAVTYAADNGAIVSQNSWGYTNEGDFEQAVLDAIDYFNANAGGPGEPMDGGIYVNAAGNNNTDGEWYPGFYEGAYAVGATNENDERAAYSTFGDWIEVSAPGGGGTTAGCGGTTDDVQSTVVGGFGALCGTSMAAPHVSGVIGLVASASPGMTNEAVEDLLINTGVDVDPDEPIGPRVDAQAALQGTEDDEIPPAMIDDLATTGVSGNSVGLEWTAPGDDGDEGTATSYDLRWSTDGPITDSTDFANANQVEGVPEPDTAGTVQADTISGLPYSAEVHFAIRAYDNVGNTSDVSNSPSASTEPGPAISVDPESFDVSLEVEESTEQTLSISHVGEPGAAPLDWSASIGAAPENMTTPSDVAAASEASGSAGGDGLAAASESFEGQRSDVGQTAMTYQLDDGTTENGLGFGGQGDDFDSMWLNAFQVVEGAGTVTQISTAWGCAADVCSAPVIPEGKEGIALVYNDPDNDGNPDDAELLSQTDITVQDPGTDNFTTVDISATPVEGTFFVAVLLQNVSSDAFPMPMDESSTHQEASWAVATTNAGTFDIEDLSNNETLSTMGDLGFPANWLLRAEGSSGFLAIDPTSGSVEQGQSQDVTATFDASGVAPGVYEASINVMSNDPSQPVTSVPSELEVTAGPPGISAERSEVDFGGVFTGTAANDTIVVNNTGGTALQVTDVSLSGSDAFVMVDSTDTGGFTIPYEESREIEVQFAPTETESASATLEVNTEEEVSTSVSLMGEGQPFVAIEPDQLEQEIDLTSGDSTATQEFTLTNQFDESLPFSVVVEALEGENVDFHPKLVDQELVRWRQMQKETPGGSGGEASLEAAPNSGQEGTSPIARLMGEEPLDVVGVTGYGNDALTPELVSFDLGLPGELSVLSSGFDSYAGNFAFANNQEIYWIDNADNTLKTYALEDGSVETVGELEPEGSDVTWSDMETDFTTGTTYVTSGEGNTNRLYELDVDDAELTHIGDFADGNLVVALAIDDEGEGYAHDITNDEILHVDLETAEAETIGSTGITANFAQSMTFDHETGQMLMAAYQCTLGICDSALRQVDRETGNTTLIGSLGDGSGEFTWMATPGTGIPWLATNLEQGTLPAGATLTLEAQYDATQVVEGDYEAQIRIVGEQLQGEPSESLPVNLTVEAAPIAFVSKDSLQYEDTFVNDTTSTQMVTLRNDGAANMNITDVSASSEAFIVTPDPDSALTLEPDEARIFEVAFAPSEVADYSATLTFDGEEVSGEVSLTGEGIPAPELAVSPESFEKQAYLGQEQEHGVEVTNDGGNPLEYDLSISAPPAQDVLLEEETFDGSFPPEGWSRAGANNGENWQADCFGGPTEIIPAAVFCWSPSTVGTQRLITPEMDTQGLSRVVAQFDHLIDIFTDPPSFEIRLESTSDGGSTWTTVETFTPEDMPITQEVITVDNEDVGSDQFQLAWTFDGDSFELNDWAVDNVTVFAEGNWLAVEPESGTIAPGESDSLTVSVDTNVPGLEEGTYESGLNFATNDPLAESSELPFTMNLIENLTVQPHPDMPEVHPNQEFAVDYMVESLDDLEVFSYELEMDFNADRMQVQEVVTEGTLSEGLALSSNIDNDAGTVTIVAADDGESESGQSTGSEPVLFDIEGEGTLVSVDATGQPDHGDMTLDMQAMAFNEGEPPATPKDSTMSVVPLYGDVTLDLSITSGDASSTLDYLVGNTDLIEAQTTQADVSGDGNVSAFDASLILRRTVGDIGCFPVAPDCGEEPALASKSASASSEGDVTFAWGEVSEPKQSSDDETSSMELPLVLNQAGTSIRSVEVSTEIDPDKVSVEDLTAQLPDDWHTVHHVSDDGALNISMAGVTPLAESRKVATITLKREESDATVEMGGNVAVNEGTAQELETKSIVSIPDEFALEGAYPNPFRQAATLEMDLPKEANVTVEVYDLLGRRVKTAHRGEMSAGSGRIVRINGTDLSSGTYFYRARVDMGDNRVTETGKMTVVQ